MGFLINKKVNNVPNKLYHASFQFYLSTIQQEGLTINNVHNWDGESQHGAIYLATDENIAESFVEAADNVNDEVFDSGYVLLEIDTNQLDKNKFYIDSNILFDEDEEIYSYEYRGNIPTSAIAVIRKWED